MQKLAESAQVQVDIHTASISSTAEHRFEHKNDIIDEIRRCYGK